MLNVYGLFFSYGEWFELIRHLSCHWPPKAFYARSTFRVALTNARNRSLMCRLVGSLRGTDFTRGTSTYGRRMLELKFKYDTGNSIYKAGQMWKQLFKIGLKVVFIHPVIT